jgi:hypothetical protein
MTDVVLLPCPFCGANAHCIGEDVRCRGCGVWGPDSTYQKSAVELWNRRAPVVPVGEER